MPILLNYYTGGGGGGGGGGVAVLEFLVLAHPPLS